MDKDMLKNLYEDFKKGDRSYGWAKMGVVSLHFLASLCGACCCCSFGWVSLSLIWWIGPLGLLPTIIAFCFSQLSIGLACSSVAVLVLMLEPKYMAFLMEGVDPTLDSVVGGPAIVV